MIDPKVERAARALALWSIQWTHKNRSPAEQQTAANEIWNSPLTIRGAKMIIDAIETEPEVHAAKK